MNNCMIILNISEKSVAKVHIFFEVCKNVVSLHHKSVFNT